MKTPAEIIEPLTGEWFATDILIQLLGEAGYVIVPKEPTVDMLVAAYQAVGIPQTPMFANAYRVMVGAIGPIRGKEMKTTDTATLVPGKIASYTEWEPTCSLRRLIHNANDHGVLEQQFIRRTLDTTGAVMGGEIEWRPIPIEVRS